jgi:hypothetical protein
MTIIENLDKNNFIYLKDEKNNKGSLGVTDNRIVEIPNFVSEKTANAMIKYFEFCEKEWGPIAFYGSKGMGLQDNDPNFLQFGLKENFFLDIKKKFQEAVELVFDKKVRPNTSHAQKWEVGGFANPHSDNSDFEGNPNAFEINKYVGILYLNGNYSGGQLYFPDHAIEFKPNAFSYYVFCGGVENIHGVKEILEGTRYTMVSFWDYADIEYSEEIIKKWKDEEKLIRIEQEKQQLEWKNGNKNA